MREPLTVAVAQPPCAPYDVEANIRVHAEVIRSARARVVVFPELSLTGYELDAPAVAPDDPRLTPLIDACRETGSLALAGAPVADGPGDGEVIAMLAVGTEATVAYRKMWLGGAEAGRFTPGTAPAVLAVDGWRLGLAICKDTGVPEHAARTAALGIDAYLAGVCDSDPSVVDERGRRVAVTQRVWVAVASFAGRTGGYDPAAGHSGIRAPGGGVVAQAGPEPGETVRATLRPPVVIDGGDKACVRLLLELRGHLADLAPGTIVHLIATDPAAPIDLPAWCHLTGHGYLGPVGSDPPTYALQVTETPVPTHPTSPWRPR
ncbi:nitrilase-related carbon-nitrogen hydrolase [Actinomadura macra]|uniref:nitrilase-related carbon-nitrogen hydrolase n=1 Tax=Actinomadura macra TaxID=46164 RepID=UPI00082E8D9A|nr:nitrilase-related carbon-nitrogen hydrolase [Actinomadura macra]